jgi:hypothetical protein
MAVFARFCLASPRYRVPLHINSMTYVLAAPLTVVFRLDVAATHYPLDLSECFCLRPESESSVRCRDGISCTCSCPLSAIAMTRIWKAMPPPAVR